MFRHVARGRAGLRGAASSTCTPPIEFRHPTLVDTPANGQPATYHTTTAGRAALQPGARPTASTYASNVTRVDKRDHGRDRRRARRTTTRRPSSPTSLDDIKNLCFRYAAQSGLTISIDDVKTPSREGGDPRRPRGGGREGREPVPPGHHHRRRASPEGGRDLDRGHRRGPRGRWRISLKAEQFNPIDMMVGSGARGNMMQVRQIAGMRGLVANPRGDMIPRPIKSNFREGLDDARVLHRHAGRPQGPRRHRAAYRRLGYLTRRLVDVAQELIINDETRLSPRRRTGAWHLARGHRGPTEPGKRNYLETRLFGRIAGRRRHARRRHRARGRHRDRRRRDGRAARRPDGRPGSGCCRRSPTSAESASRAACYGLSLATGQGHRARRSGRRHRRPVDRRARYPADHAYLPHRWCRPAARHRRRSAPRRRAVRGPQPEGQGHPGPHLGRGPHRRGRGQGPRASRSSATTAPRTPTLVPAQAPPRGRRRPGGRRRRPARRGSPRPQGAARDQGRPRDAAVPGRRGPEGVPRPGRVDPRQAHRAHRAPDDPPGRACRSRASPTSCPASGSTRRSSPTPTGGWCRTASAGRGPSRADGHHQGVAGHRLVAVGGLVPGDHPGAHRGRHRVQAATRCSASRRTSSSAS